MKLIAAYLLAVLGGNANPDAAAVSKILKSVGVEADAAALDKVIAELNGKKIEDVIAAGSAKLSSVPAAGAAPAGSAAPAAAAKDDKKGAAAAKEEPKKKKEEEKKEEEEEGGDMGFSLFD